MNKLSRFLILAFVSIAIFFVSFIVLAKPAQARCGDDDQADFKSPGAIDCGDEIWFYDPELSIRLDKPVFQDSKANQYMECEISGTNCKIKDTRNNDVYDDEIGTDDLRNIGPRKERTDDTGRFYCSLRHPTDCQPFDQDCDNVNQAYADFLKQGKNSIAMDNYAGEQTAEGGDCKNFFTETVPTSLQRQLDALLEGLENARTIEAARDACEDKLNSPLSFIACPVMSFMQDAIIKILKIFENVLTNPVLTNSKSSLLRVALGSVINIANTFYILIFLIIIFANFIAIPGFDNYTIKKTLPKLIAAIILTQFSLLICQAILDMGNILADTLPKTILGAFNLCTNPAKAFTNSIVGAKLDDCAADAGSALNGFTTIGEFLIMIIVVLAGIVIGIVSLFYLVMRYLFVVLLVLASPVAFAAWVLPNTEKFFKTWWTLFVKLSLMLFIVNILFVGGAVFSFLLDEGAFFTDDSFFSQLLGFFVPLIVLALIPKTLKVSGEVMAKAKEAAQKGLQGAKDSYAGKKVSKSAEEGKLASMKGSAYSGFGRAVGGKRGARMEAKGAGLKDKSKKQLKEDIAALSLERQIALSKKGGKVGDEAKSAVRKRKQEILNTRVLDQKAINDLEAIAESPVPEGLDGRTKLAQPGQQNPYWNDGGSPSPVTTPAPSPTPAGGGGPRVIPGTGGAVDLSGHGAGGATSAGGGTRPASSGGSTRVIPGTGGAVDLSGRGTGGARPTGGGGDVPPAPPGR